MKRNVNISLLALLFAIAFVSCKKEEPVYLPAGEGQIHIGALLPLTGSGMSAGQASQASLHLAIQDIGDYFKSAGISETLVLETADTRTDDTEALDQVKIFYNKGIRLVIGPYTDAELLLLKNFADSAGMVIVSPASTAVSLAIPADNLFRFISSDVIQAAAMNRMLTDDRIKVIIPCIRNDLWANDLLQAVRNDFVQAGGMVQDPVMYEPGTTGFQPVLARLDETVSGELDHHNPNEVAVYLLSSDEGTALLAGAKDFEHLNNVYWYGGSAYSGNSGLLADTTARLFAYTHGLPCPAYALDDAAKYKWQPLKDRLESQLGRPAEISAYTAYDALWVGALTYAATGLHPSGTVLRSAFVNTAGNYFGVTGNTVLDDNGDRSPAFYDFRAVKHDSTGYGWKRTARYDSGSGTLTRITK